MRTRRGSSADGQLRAPVPHQLARAELNGDGATDLIAGAFDRGTVTVRLANP